MDNEVVLVGTAHVSERSAEEVRETIRDERPDAVAVELDPRRYEAIKERDGAAYGGDMETAINEAESLGVPVVLIDRDIRVTVKRFWESLSFLERIKAAGALFAGFLGIGTVDVEEIERAIEEDRIDRYVEQLREFSSGGARAIIDERDAYMASRLLETDGRVVAVVGAGHEEGVRHYLENPDEIPDVPGDGYTEPDPDTDVYRSADGVLVVVDMPGFDKESVGVRVKGRTLEVEASGRNGFPKRYGFVDRRRSDKVETTVEVPARVDADGAEARYEDGVLRVRLPRARGSSG